MASLLTPSQASLINEAMAATPPWGVQYVQLAFNGDEDAAASLCVSLPDRDRARMAGLMYRAKVNPAAFRAMLTGALSQTHYYDVIAAAGGRQSLVKWLRYADYILPEGLPEMVTIYRGVQECTPRQAANGLSWSLDFEVAAWFACVYRRRGMPLVVQASVPCSDLLFYSNDRQEQEVIPRKAPTEFSIVDDLSIVEAAERRQAVQQAMQKEMIDRATMKFAVAKPVK